MLLQLLLVLPSVVCLVDSVELRWWRHQRFLTKTRTYADCNVEAKSFRHGEVFVLRRTGPCVKYRCQYGGYKVIDHGSYCRDGTRCWDLNSYRTRVCTLEQCLEIDGRVRFRLVGEGCQFESKCHMVDSTWVHHCYLYVCRREEVHLGVVYKAVLLGGREKPGYMYNIWNVYSPGCRGADGGCHDPGALFPYRLGSTLYRYCSCSVGRGNIQYDCLP